MSAPPHERVSRAEFHRLLALPQNQDRHLELWDGAIIETMQKTFHAFIQNLFAALFFNYFQTHPIGHSFTELHIAVSDEGYVPVPEVAVVLHEQGTFRWDEILPFMPALVVEIQSPDQSDRFMRDKADFYSARGVRMVITIYQKRIVEVRTPTDLKLLVPGDTLDAGDVLPGFSIEVARLFPDGQ